MKKSEKIFFIALFSILIITVTIFAVIGLSSCQTAYADYNELTGNEILNFNQYVENTYVHDYTMNTAVSTIISSLGANANDIFYLSIDYTVVSNGAFSITMRYSDNSTSVIFASDEDYENKRLFTASKNVSSFYYYSNANNQVINNVKIINLSLMFGENNDNLTIEQCSSLFTAEYYAYTESTPLTLNSFSGYEQALQDIFSSYKYSLSMNALSYTTYAVNYKNTDANFDYNTSTEQWYFQNTFAVPLFTTLNSGGQVTIDYWFYVYDLQQAWYLNVMIWNGNEYQTIYTSQEQINTSAAQTMTFNLPYDTDTLYFNIVYNNAINTSANAIVYKFNISASQLDINSMIHNAFISGQNDMARQYSPNGSKYLEIFNEGVRASQTNGAVFQDTWSFVGSAFTGIGGLLAVELIPNVPIGLFVAFPLLLGLIFFIVKVTKGGD